MAGTRILLAGERPHTTDTTTRPLPPAPKTVADATGDLPA